MRKPVYPYRKCDENTYEFVSIGKKNIVKNVEFTPTAIEGIINLGFGDLLDDGSLNDQVNSNNGDIAMVISTIINIITAYTLVNPTVKIFFKGAQRIEQDFMEEL
nr:hypothetical protein [Paraflavitalea speifideiaquila]